jgi:hypothetical protein
MAKKKIQPVDRLDTALKLRTIASQLRRQADGLEETAALLKDGKPIMTPAMELKMVMLAKLVEEFRRHLGTP